MQLIKANTDNSGTAVTLSWADSSQSRFHAIWLRDNALEPHTRSPENGQRLITLADIPADLHIANAEIVDGDLAVEFAPCATTCVYPAAWLCEHFYDHDRTDQGPQLPAGMKLFDATLPFEKVSASYHAITSSDRVLQEWLQCVVTYGFAHLTDCPVASGALLEVVKLFGFVRETNYGKWFEVKSKPSPDNLAYTSAGLQAHTDNPYRDPVPTMQLLYCLENAATGGESQVVDGFKAATLLYKQNPAYFELLSRYCVNFEYRGQAGTVLRTSMPMIELRGENEIRCIRYNNRSAAAITDVPFEFMQDFYAAYRTLGGIIDDPANQLQFKLDPGECFLVDNSRVLHARSAFELNATNSSGAGGRWLQGCYPDRDGLLSTLSVLDERSPTRAHTA